MSDKKTSKPVPEGSYSPLALPIEFYTMPVEKLPKDEQPGALKALRKLRASRAGR